MSVRPPTLRGKRRYILARFEPADVPVDAKDLYYTVLEAVTSLFGDLAAAAMQPAVIAIEEGHAFIRCRRGTERELLIALSTVTACREMPLALRILSVSGTMESLRVKRAQMAAERGKPELSPTGGFRFGAKDHGIAVRDGHKVDVIEKGFKNTNRLFLTQEDREEL